MKLPAHTRLAIVLLVTIGCATAPGDSTTPTSQPTSTTSPIASPASAPITTAPPATTADPTATPAATATPVPSSNSDEPPAAALGTSDFAVAGELGSYCWVTHCVDMATFDKSRLPDITVEGGDGLIFSLENGTFASWSASYGDDVTSPTILGQGGDEFDPDSAAATPTPLIFAEFDGPPAGDWMVAVYVRFADGGDAAYGWHVTVE